MKNQKSPGRVRNSGGLGKKVKGLSIGKNRKKQQMKLFDRCREQLKEQSGASILIAIVIMIVFMMLTLSMLLASYSLFSTVQRQQDQKQCHELALSVSETLGEMITANMSSYVSGKSDEGEEIYTSYTAEEFYRQMEDSSPLGIAEQNPLWYYLRCNLLQFHTWPFYDEDSSDINLSADMAWKTFTADFTGDEALAEYPIQVTLYWVSDKKEAEGNGDDTFPNEGAAPDLVVVVDCSKGNRKDTVTSKYSLSVGRLSAGEGAQKTFTTSYGTTIYCQENWVFTLSARK